MSETKPGEETVAVPRALLERIVSTSIAMIVDAGCEDDAPDELEGPCGACNPCLASAAVEEYERLFGSVDPAPGSSVRGG